VVYVDRAFRLPDYAAELLATVGERFRLTQDEIVAHAITLQALVALVEAPGTCLEVLHKLAEREDRDRGDLHLVLQEAIHCLGEK